MGSMDVVYLLLEKGPRVRRRASEINSQFMRKATLLSLKVEAPFGRVIVVSHAEEIQN
jgi:hypothetical protein